VHVAYRLPSSAPVKGTIVPRRQIEAGLLITGVDGAHRYAEGSEAGNEFLDDAGESTDVRSIDVWLAKLLLEGEDSQEK
jgi:hypothetical protein